MDILRGTLRISSGGYLHKFYGYVHKSYNFDLYTKKVVRLDLCGFWVDLYRSLAKSINIVLYFFRQKV